MAGTRNGCLCKLFISIHHFCIIRLLFVAEGRLYTLEDDQDTSARLRKRDFASAPEPGQFAQPPAFSLDPGDDGMTPTQGQEVPQTSRPQGIAPTFLAQRFSPQQITSSLKKLTTPSRANTAVTASGKRAAVAALTIACIGVFFTALDQTVVVTALPQIITDLQIPFTQLDHAAWIISAYLLGFIIAMPLMGRVSDIYGRRRIFLLCLSIFGVGSIFCGLAPLLGQTWDLGFLSALHIDTSSPGLIWLIAARFIQAIGGGAVVPVAMAIVSDFYGLGRRALALGIIGAVTEAGGVCGPLYGALIVQHFGWQVIFYLNVPIVLGLMIAAWFFIPKGTHLREGIDWIGAILLGLALTCLSLGLAQQGTDLGPPTPNSPTAQNNPLSLALAFVFLIAFVLVERRVRWPVIDLSLFKRLHFSATSIVSLLVGAALIIAMADIPIFVDTVLQRSVLDSGLALLRMTALIPIGALLGGWLCSRISCRFTAVLGLIFTAAGFYLMSRWPVNVNWNQITISTVTAGLGFGLVIAPIGTTAINAVRARQAGMGSAIVTSLRMVGMMLGLAALTSWALSYFKQLASQYRSLPASASAAQFAQWSQGYAHHLILAGHTVYSAVFFLSMVLCLIAIVPAIFLWGSKLPTGEDAEADGRDVSEDDTAPIVSPDAVEEDAGHQASEAPLPPPAAPASTTGAPDSIDPTELDTGSIPSSVPLADTTGQAQGTVPAFLAADAILDDTSLAPPPVPPTFDSGDGGGRSGKSPRDRRRLVIAIIGIAIVLMLVLAGVFAALLWQSPSSNSQTHTGVPGAGATDTPTATPIAGPRMIQLALDAGALTSLFVSQLGLQQGTLTDMRVVPVPNDGLVLSLNLHIDANGIHRVLPIEIDGTLGVDSQQNIQLHVLHLKRDGIDAGPTAAANMQSALNSLLLTSLMPSLRGQLKNVKFVSVHTSSSIGCAGGAEMLVLLIQAPPIQGIAAQPTPTAFCFKGPIDINKLLPQ